jgi:hypothetical protein
MKVYAYTTMVPPQVITHLGDRPHVRQARVLGAFKSRAAFVRALIAEGVERGTEGSVSHLVANYGGEGRARPGIEPGVIYVESMNSFGDKQASHRWADAVLDQTHPEVSQ